ncbi:MAG: phosphoglycerate dehydrogenase [Planctomycetota bacterium]
MSGPFKILVADDLSAEGVEILRRAGEVTVQTGLKEDALRDLLPPYHALVVRSATQVTAKALEKARNLAVIGRAGIGVDNIDVAAATERGVVVMNTPDAGATTTAEHALALLFSLARNIPAADAALKAGRWDKSKFVGSELRGKVFLVVGLGKIGRIVAERGVALGMEVVGHDPYVDESRAPKGVRLVDLDDGLAEADFVSLHVPLMDNTRNLIDAARLAKMKPSARLVHAARGGIVDETALADALDEGRLAGAAVDVFCEEPLPAEHRLRKTKNIVLTPHLGASTNEAKGAVSIDVAEQVVTCLTRGIALNGVNVPAIAPSEAHLLAPFLDLAHNLAAFLAQTFDGPLEGVRVMLQGALPERASQSLLVAALTGALQRRSEAPVTPVNARRVAERLGVRTHVEASPMKRDFVSLVRIEMMIGGERHKVSGTVLGSRHGRMVELDSFLLDAIPEGPLLVTFHGDQPGVLGAVGTLLGQAQVNVSRLQLGVREGGADEAVGIWNLDGPLSPDLLAAVRALPAVGRARFVQ